MPNAKVEFEVNSHFSVNSEALLNTTADLAVPLLRVFSRILFDKSKSVSWDF